jgi:hypothetical protein
MATLNSTKGKINVKRLEKIDTSSIDENMGLESKKRKLGEEDGKVTAEQLWLKYQKLEVDMRVEKLARVRAEKELEVVREKMKSLKNKLEEA